MKSLFFIGLLCIVYNFSNAQTACKYMSKGTYILKSDLQQCDKNTQRDLSLGVMVSVSFSRTIPGVCSSGRNYHLVKIRKKALKDRAIRITYEYDGNKKCQLMIIDNAKNVCHSTTVSKVLNSRKR